MRTRPESKGICRWGEAVVWVLAALAVSGGVLSARAATQREYELKAAVLYHIIEYVNWPSEVASNSTPVLEIGLLGAIPFPAALEVLGGKIIEGRKLNVKRLSNISEAANCHVLFLGSVEKERLAQILQAVDDRPILTVSEYEGFAEQGGMVGLVPRQNRIQPELNRRAARRVKLDFSSQLLRLAKLVDGSKE